jgi:large subunit ribosomal protein L50
LVKLGTKLSHFVPSAKLHYIQSIDDVKEFYSTPVHNITKYAQLARDETLPENLAVRENPARFHPNDKEAVHGGMLHLLLLLKCYYTLFLGVTAFPGHGGKIFGLRNKRIYRQFQPKQEWYDYEDQTFDHEPVDKGMPWDVEIAKKMDSYVDMKFKKNGFYKIR